MKEKIKFMIESSGMLRIVLGFKLVFFLRFNFNLASFQLGVS